MGLLLVQCKLLVTWLLILRTYKLKQEMHLSGCFRLSLFLFCFYSFTSTALAQFCTVEKRL